MLRGSVCSAVTCSSGDQPMRGMLAAMPCQPSAPPCCPSMQLTCIYRSINTSSVHCSRPGQGIHLHKTIYRPQHARGTLLAALGPP